jgi:RND family efflux transporter MFP subunit
MRNQLLIIPFLSLLAACDKPVEAPPPPRPALVMVVSTTTSDNAMRLVGEALPRYESVQSFRIAGKIIERKVETGTRVSKGQILARLDPVDAQLSSAAAMAEVASAEASQALAQAELLRQRVLFDKQFISASALDVKEADLKSANARLAQLKAQAKVSGNRTEYNTLTADREGVVTYINAEPGQVVAAGEAIARIADTSHIDVVVAVPESRMAEVKLQAPVKLQLWADKQKIYPGFVREISPLADAVTRTFNVRITLQDADAFVKLGMTVGVRFPQSVVNESGLLIPSSALTAVNGKDSVWVIDDNNRAQPREVDAGAFREDGVLIRSGLKAGETIAIAGVHTLNKDQVVRKISEAQP